MSNIKTYTGSIQGTVYTTYLINSIKKIYYNNSNAAIFRDAYSVLANEIDTIKDIDDLWKHLLAFGVRYRVTSEEIKKYKLSYLESDYDIIYNSYSKFCEVRGISSKISKAKLTDMVLCYYLEKLTYEDTMKNFHYEFRGPEIQISKELAIKELEFLRDIIDKRIKELKGEN